MATGKPYRRRASKVAWAVASCIVGIAFGVGIYFGDPQYPIGGVDLAGYCRSQNLEISEDYCVSPIDLKSACNWQYQRNDLLGRYTSSDPDSAACYNSAGVAIGGINDISGYCQHTADAAGMEATTSNPGYRNEWVCQEAINKDVICTSQYRVPGLQARQDKNGILTCYRRVF